MTDTKVVLFEAPGGPEVLKLVTQPLGEPGPGQVRIRHHACGLNFIDIYQRSGVYPMALPHVLGMEGAGMIEAVGEGVTHLAVGDRAAYASAPPGAYCEARVMGAAQVCRLPDSIDFRTGAAMMLQGLTTHYLFERTVPLKAGDTVLFHAAAGGVGLIACQWARAKGIRLIGTAGTDDKCALAKAHGAAEVINYEREDFVASVRELTDGRGVDVVMDSIGAATFEKSLDCLRPLGMMISFGNASGKVPPFDIGVLAAKGSLQIARPTLFTHIADHATCQSMAADLFAMVESGQVGITIGGEYALADVAQAHRDMEARATTGSLVLIP
ncbi:MAG: quinone oxidoreductase family protein [Roseinatronobacter sp.]